MARKPIEQKIDRGYPRVPTLMSLATEEVRKRWDTHRSLGMKRLFKLSAADAKTEYQLLVDGSSRARERFGIQDADDLAFEDYIIGEMKLKAESVETPMNSPVRAPLRAPSKGKFDT